MKYQLAIFCGDTHKWSADRDSEHPDFTLYCEKGEVWVSVVRTAQIDEHYERYMKGKESYLFEIKIVEDIITEIYKLGYHDKYFEMEDGLVWTEEGRLLEC